MRLNLLTFCWQMTSGLTAGFNQTDLGLTRPDRSSNTLLKLTLKRKRGENVGKVKQRQLPRKTQRLLFGLPQRLKFLCSVTDVGQ